MTASKPERRPHLLRDCPFKGCAWKQVTSWFVGGPDVKETVSQAFLTIEAEAHFADAHGQKAIKYFT